MRIVTVLTALLCAAVACPATVNVRIGDSYVKVGPTNESSSDVPLEVPFFTGIERLSSSRGLIIRFFSDSFLVADGGVCYSNTSGKATALETNFRLAHPDADVRAVDSNANLVLAQLRGDFNSLPLLKRTKSGKWITRFSIDQRGADFGLGYSCLEDHLGRVWVLVPDSNEGRGDIVLIRYSDYGGKRALGRVRDIWIESASRIRFELKSGKSLEFLAQ